VIFQEKATKRKNMLRWQKARLERLMFEVKMNRATERQVQRARQLDYAVLRGDK
jgi:hypothetical protein